MLVRLKRALVDLLSRAVGHTGRFRALAERVDALERDLRLDPSARCIALTARVDSLGTECARFVRECRHAREEEVRRVDGELSRLQDAFDFLRYEWAEALARERRRLLEHPGLASGAERASTIDSFDYQWREMNSGAGLADDAAFIRDAPAYVARLVDRPVSWFEGRRVLDVGCGAGRFTRAFLELGAAVTAADASPAALEATRSFCAPYAGRLVIERRDLLSWDETDAFDLVFCYGVVHHTGNLYLAIRNVARKVGRGGRLFLMVYGMPTDAAGFRELAVYGRTREELKGLPLSERRSILRERYGPRLAHGMFDAASPAINDLMTWPELAGVLRGFGLGPPRRTLENRNLHVVSDRE